MDAVKARVLAGALSRGKVAAVIDGTDDGTGVEVLGFLEASAKTQLARLMAAWKAEEEKEKAQVGRRTRGRRGVGYVRHISLDEEGLDAARRWRLGGVEKG